MQKFLQKRLDNFYIYAKITTTGGFMDNNRHNDLSKRERQVMDVVYKKQNVSAKDVWKEIPDIPSYSAVRSILSILEEKGFLEHRRHGKQYIYSPTLSPKKASNSALKQVLTTYFDNSLEKVVTTMLEMHSTELTDADYKRLSGLIDMARKEVKDDDADD
jgi:predicted transcriptional regulator